MNDSMLACKEEHRRRDIRAASVFGLDYAEVSDDQRTVTVFFLGKAPQKIEKANIVIAGGSRIRNLQAVSLRLHRQADPTLDDSMDVVVNQPGDFSTYTLNVIKLDEHGHPTSQPFDGFDPRYDEVDFTFKASCPSPLDCKTRQVCPPPQRTQPEINYLAKDYASFRQLILDRLALILPTWQETHVPDLGIMLVELLAYVGDYLSYYQDAVATEAYLATARQRISVRRHVRLVDYAMHEGCNSRAWVTVHTDTDESFDSKQIYFITAYPGSPSTRLIDSTALAQVPASTYEIFEPLWPAGQISIYAVHSEIHFYTWGDCQCCLPTGSTTAALIDQWVPPAGIAEGGPGTPGSEPSGSQPSGVQPDAPPAAAPPGAVIAASNFASDGPPGTVRALRHLQPGDVLIFEEVIGPKTGNPADADPKHRQAVRLTTVTPDVDPLYHPDVAHPTFGQPIVRITWAPEDALTFPLCISAQAPPPDCSCKENISVARGNVVLVDNGSSTSEPFGAVPTASTAETCPTPCTPGETTVVPCVFRPTLQSTPLTFAEPIPPGACSAAEMIVQDPRQALPEISLAGTLAAPEGETVTTWSPLYDLLESGRDDNNFVVEMDNAGYAHLRFGDGSLGEMPAAGTVFQANLRVGNGPAGNVGAETITYLVLRNEQVSGPAIAPRNPLPAIGGTAPEPLAEVKLFAPYAFRDVLERAITTDDYATITGDNARRRKEGYAAVAAADRGTDACLSQFIAVQGAKATLRWTGSWYEVLVAIDPEGTHDASLALVEEITEYLEPYRRIGHDLMVAPAECVPLSLGLTICVLPNYLRAHVEAALLDVFSNRVLPDGTLGFFHPDNLTFGVGVDVSKIVAAAMAVTGVQNAVVTELERFEVAEPAPSADQPGEELPPGGVLSLGPLEIARLDNDPNFPENGRLTLDVRGGR
jgi:hypothetical protein